MRCDLPSATFRRTGLKGSIPHQLAAHLSSYLPSSLPCSFPLVLGDSEKTYNVI